MFAINMYQYKGKKEIKCQQTILSSSGINFLWETRIQEEGNVELSKEEKTVKKW